MKSDPHGTRIPSKRRATNETNKGERERRERSTYQGLTSDAASDERQQWRAARVSGGMGGGSGMEEEEREENLGMGHASQPLLGKG